MKLEGTYPKHRTAIARHTELAKELNHEFIEDRRDERDFWRQALSFSPKGYVRARVMLNKDDLGRLQFIHDLISDEALGYPVRRKFLNIEDINGIVSAAIDFFIDSMMDEGSREGH